jgi:small subunit ribosomal protein S14
MKRPAIEKIIVGKTKRDRFRKHNLSKPRKFGRNLKRCKRCGSFRRHIDKYGLDICGRCLREIYAKIGFKKLN